MRMRHSHLIVRGLTYYWRTNIAVVLGVATAVAVLAGALLVGDSVRGSLRDLVLQRLGRADIVVLSSGFFREALAAEFQRDQAFGASFDGVAPLVVLQGLVTDQASGRRASRVQVYGVDDRFWRFHGVSNVQGPAARDALVNHALAAEIGAAVGGTVLVRVERPSSIPIESLHGRKDNIGRTVRLTVRAIAAAAEAGDFSLQPQQGDVRVIFVPLRRLQQDLDVADRVNALLLAARRTAANAENPAPAVRSSEEIIRRRFALEDVGMALRVVRPERGQTPGSDPGVRPAAIAVESAAGLLDQPRANAVDAAAADAGMTP